jgi:hypothetical protein
LFAAGLGLHVAVHPGRQHAEGIERASYEHRDAAERERHREGAEHDDDDEGRQAANRDEPEQPEILSCDVQSVRPVGGTSSSWSKWARSWRWKFREPGTADGPVGR